MLCRTCCIPSLSAAWPGFCAGGCERKLQLPHALLLSLPGCTLRQQLSVYQHVFGWTGCMCASANGKVCRFRQREADAAAETARAEAEDLRTSVEGLREQLKSAR